MILEWNCEGLRYNQEVKALAVRWRGMSSTECMWYGTAERRGAAGVESSLELREVMENSAQHGREGGRTLRFPMGSVGAGSLAKCRAAHTVRSFVIVAGARGVLGGGIHASAVMRCVM